MNIMEAFISPSSDSLFNIVATFGDADELLEMDVVDGQSEARKAINTAINNAILMKSSPGARFALIKGETGTGKSHVLTTELKKWALSKSAEIYPLVLQLTAPVKVVDYEKWLLDATFRELASRHFANDRNQSPLRRMAERLLDRIEVDDQDHFLSILEKGMEEDDASIIFIKELGITIRKQTQDLLDQPPSGGLIAIILLAGFGNFSAVKYLRRGQIDKSLIDFNLDTVETASDRLMLLKDFGIVAQITGSQLVFGIDQVENAIELSKNNELFIHAFTQTMRIAESLTNCSVVVAVLADVYDHISSKLAAGDRDRIELEKPFPVRLTTGSPEFYKQVIAQRLNVMRKHAGFDSNIISHEPLPDWFLTRLDHVTSTRAALHEVSKFREHSVLLGDIPSQSAYPDSATKFTKSSAVDLDREYDKEWHDYLDTAPATMNKLLLPKKTQLIAWWVYEASREFVNGEPAKVTVETMDDAEKTNVLNIDIQLNGTVAERRQLALCEAANQKYKLKGQIEAFLDFCTGTAMILRTGGFPKGTTSQPAPAIRKLEEIQGRKYDILDTEWHKLQRAKDFADDRAGEAGFFNWRRVNQWLVQLLEPLRDLIVPSEPIRIGPATGSVVTDGGVGGSVKPFQVQPDLPMPDQIFPVFIGSTEDGKPVFWDPFKKSPNQLNNFSFLITGDSGSGKTQSINVLIAAACKEDLGVCIFDFKADYCDPKFAKAMGLDVVDIRAHGLPFNPMQPPPRGASGVQAAEHAYELSGILSRVFKLGPVQEGLLREAIAHVYENHRIPTKEWVDPEKINWPGFAEVIAILHDNKNAAALVVKLSALSDLGLFPASGRITQSFADFIDRRVVMKLSDLPNDEMKKALAEIMIIQLHGYAIRGDQPRQLKRVIVFDEAHRVRDSMRLETLAREGRAFGVGIIIGTQYPGDIPDVLAGSLATKLYLMNSQAGHRQWIVKQMYGSGASTEAKKLLKQLTAFKPFDALFDNSHSPMTLLHVKPYYDRQ